jgi:hypothetical protein
MSKAKKSISSNVKINFFLFYCYFYTLHKPAISQLRNTDTWNPFRATKSFYFSLYFPNCFKYRYDTELSTGSCNVLPFVLVWHRSCNFVSLKISRYFISLSKRYRTHEKGEIIMRAGRFSHDLLVFYFHSSIRLVC